MQLQLSKNLINFQSSRAIQDSSKDWDKFSENKIPSSLALNPVIFNYIAPQDKILDVGMGFGKTVFDLYQRGYKNISGIDSNQSGVNFAIHEAKNREITPNPIFTIGNANELPFKDKEFNAIITQAFWTTIVDNDDRKNVINEINRVLKKNGILYIADFGQTQSIEKYKKRYDRGVVKGYDQGTFEVINEKTGELEYLAHHYTKTEFSELLKDAGFKIEVYNIKPVQTRSGSTINGHFIIARKK